MVTESVIKYNLPVPKYKVGQKVLLSSIDKLSLTYMRKCILRHEIKDARAFYNRMIKSKKNRKLYGGKLQPHTKKTIISMMNMVRTAHTVEIAGMAPREALVCGSIANQCYLTKGSSHGGIYYCYQLLFRALVDGNELAYIPEIPLISEHWLVVEDTIN